MRSIPAHNWKATWHYYSNVSYADIVKGTIHQVYGKNSVNGPLKVNCQLKSKKAQNINRKVSNLNTHIGNTNFNIVKCVRCAKRSDVQCKNVGKPRENVNKLSTNCVAKGKNLNIGSCNVSNVNYSSNNKLRVSLPCQNNSQLQTNGVFEDVNRFACLQQVSDNNTWSVLSVSSTVSKNNVKNDCEISTHDVVPHSSNTCVSNSNCNVARVKVNNNCKKLTDNPCTSEVVDGAQSAVSVFTVDSPTSSQAVQTIDNANFTSSKVSSNINKRVRNHIDSNPDKYDLDLRFRPRHREAVAKAKNCELFKEWDNQTIDKYGFIPLSQMMLPKNSSLATILDVHRSIVNTKTHNFMEAQIEIESQLNPDVWDKYLKNYWDKQLPLLIRYGFPLDFDNASPLQHEENNHASANLFTKDVSHYLQEEMGFKAILGPFDAPPIKNLHIYPFMTRPKPSSDHRRVIIDLSFPKGQSVNQGVSSDQYLNTSFILSLPTIDNITQKIRKYGKGSLIYKIDISHAFRHVKIDPDSYFLLGLKLDKYYLDTCLPFGYRHGSAICQRITDSIRYIMAKAGYSLTNYIDDLVGNATVSQAEPAFQKLKKLLQELSLTISQNKLVAPTTKCVSGYRG